MITKSSGYRLSKTVPVFGLLFHLILLRERDYDGYPHALHHNISYCQTPKFFFAVLFERNQLKSQKRERESAIQREKNNRMSIIFL